MISEQPSLLLQEHQPQQWAPASPAMILPDDDEHEIQTTTTTTTTATTIQINHDDEDHNDHSDDDDESMTPQPLHYQQQHVEQEQQPNDDFFQLPCSPQELKLQKKRFVVFARILVEHLQRTDPALCRRVRDILRDCSVRTRRREPGYESCVASVHARLRPLVPRRDWLEAERYLKRFFLRRTALPVISQDGS